MCAQYLIDAGEFNLKLRKSATELQIFLIDSIRKQECVPRTRMPHPHGRTNR